MAELLVLHIVNKTGAADVAINANKKVTTTGLTAAEKSTLA